MEMSVTSKVEIRKHILEQRKQVSPEQRAIWDKCVKITTSTEATDKKNKEDIEYGKIWSE